MRRRESVLPAPPSRWPWVRVQMPGVLEAPLVFRVPSLGAVQRHVAPWQQAQTAGDIAAQQAIAGSFVARAWADPTYELEADAANGEAVAEELHEAGWSFAALVGVMSRLVELATERAVTEQEVQVAVDFFGGTGASKPTG